MIFGDQFNLVVICFYKCPNNLSSSSTFCLVAFYCSHGVCFSAGYILIKQIYAPQSCIPVHIYLKENKDWSQMQNYCKMFNKFYTVFLIKIKLQKCKQFFKKLFKLTDIFIINENICNNCCYKSLIMLECK